MCIARRTVDQGICHQSQQGNQSVLPARLTVSVNLQLATETHRTNDTSKLHPDSWTRSITLVIVY